MSFSNGQAVEPTDRSQLPAGEICGGDILEYFRVSFENPYRRMIGRHTAVIISVEEQIVLEAIGQNRLGRPIEIEILDLDTIKEGRVIIWRLMGESWSRIMDVESSC